ncbi:hypothetical protein YC2023_093479 [Brassica napus]
MAFLNQDSLPPNVIHLPMFLLFYFHWNYFKFSPLGRSDKTGMIQKRLAWLLCKDDTHKSRIEESRGKPCPITTMHDSSFSRSHCALIHQNADGDWSGFRMNLVDLQRRGRDFNSKGHVDGQVHTKTSGYDFSPHVKGEIVTYAKPEKNKVKRRMFCWMPKKMIATDLQLLTERRHGVASKYVKRNLTRYINFGKIRKPIIVAAVVCVRRARMSKKSKEPQQKLIDKQTINHEAHKRPRTIRPNGKRKDIDTTTRFIVSMLGTRAHKSRGHQLHRRKVTDKSSNRHVPPETHRKQEPVVRTAATERKIKHHQQIRTSGKLHIEQEPPDQKATITIDKNRS